MSNTCVGDEGAKALADVLKVTEGMGYDKRIGASFLNAGIGFGGSCFPKDVDAFIRLSEKSGYDFHLLRAVRQTNEEQKAAFVRLIEDKLWIVKGKTIGVLGLAFKPNTDDMRNAPSVDIINRLQAEGAKIRAHDPQAIGRVVPLELRIHGQRGLELGKLQGTPQSHELNAVAQHGQSSLVVHLLAQTVEEHVLRGRSVTPDQ